MRTARLIELITIDTEIEEGDAHGRALLGYGFRTDRGDGWKRPTVGEMDAQYMTPEEIASACLDGADYPGCQ